MPAVHRERISNVKLITPPQITPTPVDSSRSDAAAFKGTPDSPQNTKKPAPRHSDSARYELAKLAKMEVAWVVELEVRNGRVG